MGIKNNLEIERKFLLRRVPEFNREEVEKHLIHQIYVDINGEITRFRMIEKFGNIDENFERKYFQCNKKFISTGVFEEIENEITPDLFRDMTHREHSYIIKTRYVYEHSGFKWEIDLYHDIELVTLEVELVDINQEINIPEIINNELIIEVTGQKAFSNQNLSIKENFII